MLSTMSCGWPYRRIAYSGGSGSAGRFPDAFSVCSARDAFAREDVEPVDAVVGVVLRVGQRPEEVAQIRGLGQLDEVVRAFGDGFWCKYLNGARCFK
jgi:hypothetical protein